MFTDPLAQAVLVKVTALRLPATTLFKITALGAWALLILLTGGRAAPSNTEARAQAV